MFKDAVAVSVVFEGDVAALNKVIFKIIEFALVGYVPIVVKERAASCRLGIIIDTIEVVVWQLGIVLRRYDGGDRRIERCPVTNRVVGVIGGGELGKRFLGERIVP